MLSELLQTLESGADMSMPPLFSDSTIDAIMGDQLRSMAAEVSKDMETKQEELIVEMPSLTSLEEKACEGTATSFKTFECLEPTLREEEAQRKKKAGTAPSRVRETQNHEITGVINENKEAYARASGPGSDSAERPVLDEPSLDHHQMYLTLVNGQMVCDYSGSASLTALPPGHQLKVSVPGAMVQYVPFLESMMASPRNRCMDFTGGPAGATATDPAAQSNSCFVSGKLLPSWLQVPKSCQANASVHQVGTSVGGISMPVAAPSEVSHRADAMPNYAREDVIESKTAILRPKGAGTEAMPPPPPRLPLLPQDADGNGLAHKAPLKRGRSIGSASIAPYLKHTKCGQESYITSCRGMDGNGRAHEAIATAVVPLKPKPSPLPVTMSDALNDASLDLSTENVYTPEDLIALGTEIMDEGDTRRAWNPAHASCGVERKRKSQGPKAVGVSSSDQHLSARDAVQFNGLDLSIAPLYPSHGVKHEACSILPQSWGDAACLAVGGDRPSGIVSLAHSAPAIGTAVATIESLTLGLPPSLASSVASVVASVYGVVDPPLARRRGRKPKCLPPGAQGSDTSASGSYDHSALLSDRRVLAELLIEDPSRLSLSKPELKKLVRKEKNRRSAKISRQRMLDYTSSLEKRVEALRLEQETLLSWLQGKYPSVPAYRLLLSSTKLDDDDVSMMTSEGTLANSLSLSKGSHRPLARHLSL